MKVNTTTVVSVVVGMTIFAALLSVANSNNIPGASFLSGAFDI